jgi:hypothetical protein
MNRLTALETNNTLYARYMEEQAAGVREMLRRLSEDVGRLEGIVSFFFPHFFWCEYSECGVDDGVRERHRHICINGLCRIGRGKEIGSRWSMESLFRE